MNKIKISLGINIITFVLVVVASIIMFAGFKFMHGYEIILESTKVGMLRFFTVESNLLIGFVSLVFSLSEIKLLKGNIKEIPKIDYILKLMSTSAVGLTFFVVFVYLGPISKGGIFSMLMNSNLFFHLIVPALSLLNFIFFEKTNKLRFKHTFYGIIPTIMYGGYYTINVLIHTENGIISPIYDWYLFVQNGVWTAIIVAPMIIVITYSISLVLWKMNKCN